MTDSNHPWTTADAEVSADDLGRIEVLDAAGNHGVKPCDHPNVPRIENAS